MLRGGLEKYRETLGLDLTELGGEVGKIGIKTNNTRTKKGQVLFS
jgi:hypothetical protein